MQKTIEESRREWRQAFWVIVIAIFGALAASVVGLALFHGLPGAR
jgi:nitrate reductase NapE component